MLGEIWLKTVAGTTSRNSSRLGGSSVLGSLAILTPGVLRFTEYHGRLGRRPSRKKGGDRFPFGFCLGRVPKSMDEKARQAT